MNQFVLVPIPIFFLFFFNHVKAQDSPVSDTHFFHPFRPKASAVVGVMAIMFSLVCLILTYAKFCQRRHNRFNLQNHQGLLRSNSRESGIDKTVIDRIPFFRFSSLKGSKKGLECAVCLSVFEETEILRLLPKCKHAFHKNCIDEWLESHSSCPLCRHRFDAADVTSYSYSNRISHIPSNLSEDRHLELYIAREQDRQVSSRFSFGSSFLKSGQDKHTELPIRDDGNKRDDQRKLLHKFKHKITVSHVVVRNRWSDFNCSDLLSLSSEMLNDTSSQRFSLVNSNSARFRAGNSMNEQVMNIKKDMEKKRLYESTFGRFQRSNSTSSSTSNHEAYASRQLNATEKRSKSEITKVARFMELSPQNKIKESPLTGISREEERTRRLWLPIAQRTLHWFAGREILESDSKWRPPNV